MIKVFFSQKVFASRFAKFGVVGVLLILQVLLLHYVMPFEKWEMAKKKNFIWGLIELLFY